MFLCLFLLNLLFSDILFNISLHLLHLFLTETNSKRENKLLKLLERYRSSNNSYDCIVPGSGGKDSAYQSHVLKYKYGMNPLTITWSPIIYTDYGYENWKNWLDEGGFDNILIKSSGLSIDLST